MDLLTLQMAKNYTDETAEGMGIQKGKNCQIQSIEDITGGHRITFAWYDEDQVLQTDTVDIMDGPEGPEGPQGPQGEVGESGVGFGPVPEVMPEGVNWWIDPNGEPNTAATINDANVSEDETWSSKKISDEIDGSIGTQLFDGVEEAGGIDTSTGEDDDTATNNRRIPKSHAIHVVPGATYYLTKSGGKIRFAFYEEDGTYVGNVDALGNSLMDTAVTGQKMVPPAGAYRFRVYSSASIVSHDFCCNSGVNAKMDLMQEGISQINRDLAEVLKTRMIYTEVAFENGLVEADLSNYMPAGTTRIRTAIAQISSGNNLSLVAIRSVDTTGTSKLKIVLDDKTLSRTMGVFIIFSAV